MEPDRLINIHTLKTFLLPVILMVFLYPFIYIILCFDTYYILISASDRRNGKIENIKTFLYLLLHPKEVMNDSEKNEVNNEKKMKLNLGNIIKYKIISENSDFVSSSNRLKIELYKRVDIQILKKIAMKLRSSRKQYDRLWIWYFIKGIDPNKGAWAVSHFKPEGLV
ncbi:MAG: hypothetical protein GY750_19920, partial [Lentisphaerae bacterium]|nr:hypothetical protein [Lentisphaerota bacterium]